MTSWDYTPGRRVAVVGRDTALLVDLPLEDPLVAELVDCLAGSPSLDQVAEVLLSEGLRRVSGFAAVSFGADEARVLVRGAFSARADGREPISGSGLWADRTLAGVQAVTLAVGAPTGPSLPVSGGVVLAESVTAHRDREGGVGQLHVPASVPPAPSEAVADGEQPHPVVASVEAADGERSDQVAAVAVAEERAATPPLPPEPVVVPVAAAAPEPVPVPAEPVTSAVTAAADVPVPGDHGGGLIESFPWAYDRGVEREPEPPRIEVAAEPAQPDLDQESLEMTIDRSRLIEHLSSVGSAELVVAARCPAGHLSPAYADGCRVCHQPIPPQVPVEVPRPPLGVLRLSNGDVVTLDRGAILGRNPRLPAGYTGEQPNLVRLSDPGKDISGQHLEVRLDYWHVLVSDLGSTNGTQVILPGQPPIQLRAEDPLVIEPGTRVILAGVFEFTFEVTS